VGIRATCRAPAEPKPLPPAGSLAKLGYLSARKAPGKTHERTVYTLNDKGLQALRRYARTPVAFTRLKSEPLLRLLRCDLVGEDVTRESITTLRDDIADIRQRLNDTERSARQLPDCEKYLLIVTGFLRQLLELHLDLIDESDGSAKATQSQHRLTQPRVPARSQPQRHRSPFTVSDYRRHIVPLVSL
jgi:DNA-binding PadR family transcriptional regulator